MFGPFNDPRVAAGIANAFGGVSEKVRDRRQWSMGRNQLLGDSDRREESDTDEVIYLFEKEIKCGIESVREGLSQLGIEIEVEFEPTNVASEESPYGLDFGVRLHIEGPDYNISKGVLFQCKRMYGPEADPHFTELRGRGQDQAVKMLKVTPASFFLLFNGLPHETLFQWIKVNSTWGMFPPAHWHELLDYTVPRLAAWNTGIMVLPATRVFAESRVCKKKNTPFPTHAMKWMEAGLPFGVFMADLFGTCFVGDVRESVLRIVTPPRLRDIAIDGVADFDPSMLSVRRLMNITVRAS